MKRLRVFVCLAALLFAVFSASSFSVSAQVTTVATIDSSTFTHDVAKSNVLPLFDAFINAINKDVQDLTSLQNTPEGKRMSDVYKTLAPKLVSIMGEAKNTYNRSYDTTLTPAKAQLAAILKVRQYLGSQVPQLSVDMRKITNLNGQGGFYNIFTNNLSRAEQAASQIDQGQVGNFLAPDPAAITNAQAQATVQREAAANGECTLWSWSIGNCISAGVTWVIKNTLLQIAGFLVWISANMFNYSVKVGILEFSRWAPDTLYPIWIIVRQVVSLVLVFVGLYLGFMYILGREERFEKYIPWVVIFGLFVNFSYPLARTAIDVSNIVSLKIYASAVGNTALTASITSQDTAGALIMGKLGLAGLVASAVSEDQASKGMLGQINSIPGALLAVAFVLYAAYIFFMVTGIIAIRTAALIFITIVSPLLLVDSVLPLLGEKAKWLRKIFFEQLIVGPVFMVMLAITLKFLSVFSNMGGPLSSGSVVGIASSATSTSSSIVTFFNLLMMLIMLHIMMKVTKEVSGSMGNYATEAMGKVGGFGLGVATGGAGFLARKSIGGLAMKARDSKWVETNQNSFIGRRAYDLSNSVAKSTFDLRNSKVIAKGAGMAGMSTGMLGVGMGTGSKATIETETKERMEKIKARQERIKTRHERDVYKLKENGEVEIDAKTGLPVLLAKKGDTDKDGVAAKERYMENKGGALFLTKKQKDEMENQFVEEKTKNSIEKYTKLTRREKNATYSEFLIKLEEAQKNDKNLEKQESRSIVRTLDEMKKDQDGFEKQINNLVERYQKTPDEKKKDFIPNIQEKDLRDAVTAKLSREDRLRRVETGRNANVEQAKAQLAPKAKELNDLTAEEGRKAQEKTDEINTKYDKELEELKKPKISPILSADGKPIITEATQEQIGALEKRRAEELATVRIVIDERLQQNVAALERVYDDAVTKKQLSDAKVVPFTQDKDGNSREDLASYLKKRALEKARKEKEAQVTTPSPQTQQQVLQNNGTVTQTAQASPQLGQTTRTAPATQALPNQPGTNQLPPNLQIIQDGTVVRPQTNSNTQVNTGESQEEHLAA
jgi:hypothetical protein